jgi:HSP20 family protein
MHKSMLPDIFGRRSGGLDMFRSLHREIDHLFDDFTRGFPTFGDAGIMPVNLDVAETDKAFEVTAELPGAKPEDVDISLSDGVLTVKGEKKTEKDDKQKNYHMIERSYGSFQRSFRLPAEVDPNKVEARFDNGVLRITLPKAPEAQSKIKKIEVKPSAKA